MKEDITRTGSILLLVANMSAVTLDDAFAEEMELNEAIRAVEELGTAEEIQSALDSSREEHTLSVSDAPLRPTRAQATMILMQSISDRDGDGNFVRLSSEKLFGFGALVDQSTLDNVSTIYLNRAESQSKRKAELRTNNCKVLRDQGITDEEAIRITVISQATQEDSTIALEHEKAYDQLLSKVDPTAALALEKQLRFFLEEASIGQKSLDQAPYLESIAWILRPIMKLNCFDSYNNTIIDGVTK